MFERLTEKARGVIFVSRKEAVQGSIETVEPEHLLLGLMREDKQLMNKLLPINTNSIDKIRNKIDYYNSAKKAKLESVDIPLSVKAKEILISADLISKTMNHSKIGTIHLLYGIVNCSDKIIEKVLHEIELNKEDVEKEISLFETQSEINTNAITEQIMQSKQTNDKIGIQPITRDPLTFDELKEIVKDLRKEAFGLVRKCIWICEIIDEMKQNYQQKEQLDSDNNENKEENDKL
jgi:ATP-dependent Clp protease ATP-binding subunit ClpC